jgi:hypothetical protein
MENFLPQPESLAKTLEESVEKNQFEYWKVPASDRPLPKFLEKKSIFDNAQLYEYPTVKQPAPNQKYYKKEYDDEQEDKFDPSPLSSSQRGVVSLGESSAISWAPVERVYRAERRSKTKTSDHKLTIDFLSLQPIDMELYVHCRGGLQDMLLTPYENLRLAVDKEKKKRSPDTTDTEANHLKESVQSSSLVLQSSDVEPVQLIFAPSKRATAGVTSRQEVIHFEFEKGPIGIQVVMVAGKLTCAMVLPDSQATQYGSRMDGAEILAVNNSRVLGLSDFQQVMRKAQEDPLHRNIVISAACYKGGRMKVDELYASNLLRRTRNVTSLFSNLMGHKGGSPNGPNRTSSFDDGSQVTEDDDSTVQESSVGTIGPGDSLEDEDEEHEEYTDANGMGEGKYQDEGKGEEEGKYVHPNNRLQNEQNKETEYTHSSEERQRFAEGKDEFPLEDGDDDINENHEDGLVAPRKVKINEPEMRIMKTSVSQRNAAQDEKSSPKEAKKPVSFASTKETGGHQSTDWNELTATDIFMYRTLLCVPESMGRSLSWGQPRHIIQFGNFSTRWDMQVFWVDPDCCLIQRRVLKQGDRHMEMISDAHVWCVYVSLSKLAEKNEEEPCDRFLDPDCDEEVANFSPLVALLKPTAAVLRNSTVFNMLWTPWKTLTITRSGRKDNQKGKDGEIDPSPNTFFHII